MSDKIFNMLKEISFKRKTKGKICSLCGTWFPDSLASPARVCDECYDNIVKRVKEDLGKENETNNY